MKTKIKIFFAHSAGAQNGIGQGSFGLVADLRAKSGDDYEILYPVVKEPEAPAYHHWKTLFDQEFEKLNEPVILVGHSLGGSVLLKYLSEEKINLQVAAMFFVAIPQWSADGWDMAEFAVEKDFVTHLPPALRPYFYHCIHDPVVPFAHLDFYRKAFKQAVFRELSCDEHVFAKGLAELTADIRSLAT